MTCFGEVFPAPAGRGSAGQCAALPPLAAEPSAPVPQSGISIAAIVDLLAMSDAEWAWLGELRRRTKEKG